MMSRATILMIFALALATALPGCDKQQTDDATNEEPRAFTWRDAAESTPEQILEALGPYEGCDPSQRLPSMGPQNRQRWLSRAPYCHFGEEAAAQGQTEHHPAYRISSIAYSSGQPAIIVLVPRTETTLSVATLIAFDLPNLAVEQHVWTHPPVAHRHVKQYRAAEAVSPGEVLGVDLISGDKDPNRLARVQINLATSDGMGKHLVSSVGPLVAQEDLVLPITTSRLRVTAGPYAEVGQSRVRLGPMPQFPAPADGAKDAGAHDFAASRIEGDSEGENAAWRASVKAFLKEEEKRQKKLGQVFDGLLYVAADHMTPAAVLRGFLLGARDAGAQRFKLVGRTVAPSKTKKARFGMPRVTNLGLGRTSSTTGDAKGTLTANLSLRGVGLVADGSDLWPKHGCEVPGPTLCVRGHVDVSAKFDEARQLQNKGKLDAAQKLALEGLDAYDWAGVYKKLVEVKEDHPDLTILRVRITDDQVPVAALVRLMDIARYKLRQSDAQESVCASEIGDDQSWMQTQPCTDEERDVALFSDVVLLPTKKDCRRCRQPPPADSLPTLSEDDLSDTRRLIESLAPSNEDDLAEGLRAFGDDDGVITNTKGE